MLMTYNHQHFPCFYCESKFHFTENCTIYKTEESRQKIRLCKKCCSQCTGIRKRNNGEDKWCAYCRYHRKCYYCFSTDHFTLDCRDRFKVLKVRPPSIDQNLLSRFVQLLELEEKYFLACKFPVIFNSIILKHVKIVFQKNLSFSNITMLQDFDCIVADGAQCTRPFLEDKPENEALGSIGISPSKPMTFRFKHLEIKVSKISFNEFLQLLSSKTKILKCGKTQFFPNAELVDILKRAPYLEELDLKKTNIEVDDFWPYDLMQLYCSRKMKQIHLPIVELSFNTKMLAKLIKQKHAKIYLYMDASGVITYEKTNTFLLVINKLSSHFMLTDFSGHLTMLFKHDGIMEINNSAVSETFNYDAVSNKVEPPIESQVLTNTEPNSTDLNVQRNNHSLPITFSAGSIVDDSPAADPLSFSYNGEMVFKGIGLIAQARNRMTVNDECVINRRTEQTDSEQDLQGVKRKNGFLVLDKDKQL